MTNGSAIARPEIHTCRCTCDIFGGGRGDDVETAERSFRVEGRDHTTDLGEKDQRGLDRVLTGLVPGT